MLLRASALGLAACLAGCGEHRPPEAAHAVTPVPSAFSPVTTPTLPPGPSPRPGGEAKPTKEPAPFGARWGTAQPVTFVAASPDRRWVSVCQARADTNGDGRVSVDVGPQGELGGDRLEGYFIAEPGGGARIDAFGGADPSGRFVAFMADARLVLRDTLSDTEVVLGGDAVDLRDDRGSFQHPRAVVFDPTGRRLLYLRKHGGSDEVVVRDLEAGTETAISPGDGDLWRAEFDASGEWVILKMVTTDTNGNGRLDWPLPAARDTWMRCAGPLPRYAAWERPGDDTTPRIARASGGAAIDAPGLIVPFGDSLLERDVEGALVVAKPSGERTTVSRKSCAGKLLHADAARGLIVATCDNKKGRADIRFLSHGADKSLGLEILAPSSDRWAAPASRLLPVYPGGDTVLIDLESGETIRLLSGDRVLLTVENRALVLRGRSLVLYEKGTADRVLSTDIDPLSHVVKSDGVILVPPVVVDVAKGGVIGRAESRGLAVSRDGAVLVATGGSADATHLATGPLTWIKSE